MADKYSLEKLKITRKNHETGQIEEVETRKVHKISVKPDDEFYMVYIKYMSVFYGLKYADDIKMLAMLCSWAEFNKGVVYLTSSRRKEITETMGIHNSNISNSLKRLKELNLIFGSDGEFEINPTVFWKGSKQTRMDVMQKEGIQVKFNFVMEGDIKPTSGLSPSNEFDK